MAVFKQLAKIVNPTGTIGMVGVYRPRDPEGVNSQAREGMFEIPWGIIFEKGLTIGMGQTLVKKYANHLRDLIISGKVKPSIIVSHDLTLEEAPKAYELFDMRGIGDGKEYTKIVLHP
jgi:glutathione-independent formaldehyde dehydrogenase